MLKKISCLILLLALSGCAKHDFNVAKIQEYYTDLTAVTANIDVTTNTGVQLQYSFTCEKSKALSKITITAPQALAGISANIEQNNAKINYDSTMVETLLPSLCGFVPIDAFDGAIIDLKDNVPANTQVNGKDIMLCYTKVFEGFEGEKRIYVNRETLAIEKAQFFLDDALVMEFQVTLFNPV